MFFSNGPRFRPVLFESRANMSYEHNYEFVREVVCEWRRISACRKYLWNVPFYYLCDYNSIKEVLEYNGSIHQLKCWSRELLAYKFVCIHLPSKMMKDIDERCCHIDPLIHRYLIDATTICSKDIYLCPFALYFYVFSICFNPRHVSHIDIPQHTTLYKLYPLRWFFIIILFVSLPT